MRPAQERARLPCARRAPLLTGAARRDQHRGHRLSMDSCGGGRCAAAAAAGGGRRQAAAAAAAGGRQQVADGSESRNTLTSQPHNHTAPHRIPSTLLHAHITSTSHPHHNQHDGRGDGVLPRWSYRFTWGRDQWTLAQDCGGRKEKKYYVSRTEMISVTRGVSWRREKKSDQLSWD